MCKCFLSLCVHMCMYLCLYLCIQVSLFFYFYMCVGRNRCMYHALYLGLYMHSHSMFILVNFVTTNCDCSNYKNNLSKKKFIWAQFQRTLSPLQQRRHSNSNRIWLKITVQILADQESESLGDQTLDCTIQNIIPDDIFLQTRTASQQSTTQRTCNSKLESFEQRGFQI